VGFELGIHLFDEAPACTTIDDRPPTPTSSFDLVYYTDCASKGAAANPRTMTYAHGVDDVEAPGSHGHTLPSTMRRPVRRSPADADFCHLRFQLTIFLCPSCAANCAEQQSMPRIGLFSAFRPFPIPLYPRSAGKIVNIITSDGTLLLVWYCAICASKEEAANPRSMTYAHGVEDVEAHGSHGHTLSSTTRRPVRRSPADFVI